MWFRAILVSWGIKNQTSSLIFLSQHKYLFLNLQIPTFLLSIHSWVSQTRPYAGHWVENVQDTRCRAGVPKILNLQIDTLIKFSCCFTIHIQIPWEKVYLTVISSLESRRHWRNSRKTYKYSVLKTYKSSVLNIFYVKINDDFISNLSNIIYSWSYIPD